MLVDERGAVEVKLGVMGRGPKFREEVGETELKGLILP